MNSVDFNVILLDISNQLSDQNLKDLKFLVKDELGKRALERTDSGAALFQIMKERCKLGPENTDYLTQLLIKIQRHDLADRLNGRTGAAVPPVPHPEREKLDLATEVISENLGKQWRKLGRKLHVSNVKLENIAIKHPSDLEETAVELLRQWRESRGAEASPGELIAALRACDLNLTADKVEERIAALDVAEHV